MSLTTRQRLALTRGVLDPASALAMHDSEIDLLFLQRKRVPTNNIRTAKLFPLDLVHRGLPNALGLRELGFDCIDLLDAHPAISVFFPCSDDATHVPTDVRPRSRIKG